MIRTDSVADPAYLEVPCTSCIGQVDALSWAEEPVPLRAGGYVLGIRANTPALRDLLHELFVDRLVPDAQPDRNYSIWLTERSEAGVRDLHRLYRTFVRTMRSRSARRVLDTLWHELDVRDLRAAGEQPLFDVAVLVRDGQAHLLPGVLRRTIVDDLRRWEQHGYRLLERGWTTVDLAAGEVVVPAPRWPVTDEELTRRLDVLDLDDREEGPSPAGRLPIATWTTDAGKQSIAARVGQAGMTVLDRDQRLNPTLLVGLSALFARVGDLGPSWGDVDELRQALHGLPRL